MEPDGSEPAASPDGRRLALLLEGDDDPDIGVLDLRRGTVRRLVESVMTTPHFSPLYTWSPKSDALLLARTIAGHDKIVRVDAVSGKARVLAKAGRARLGHASYSPDGSRIAYTYFDREQKTLELWLMSADGSGKHMVSAPANSPKWSPDGKQIAFFAAGTLFEGAALVTVDIGSGKEKLLTDVSFNGGPSSINWSPDGKSLLFTRRPTESIGPFDDVDIYRLDFSTGNESLIVRNANFAAWSPAGDRILFTKQLPRPRGTTWFGIYTASPSGEDEVLVGLQGEDEIPFSVPVWLPDAGTTVAPWARRAPKRCAALRRLRGALRARSRSHSSD